MRLNSWFANPTSRWPMTREWTKLSPPIFRVDAGMAPTRREWLARHPDVADDFSRLLRRDGSCGAAIGTAAALPPLADNATPFGQPPTMPFGATADGHNLNDNSPRRFGDYELLDEIALGGMGVVYKVRQVSRTASFAKDDPRRPVRHPEDVLRFRAEAETHRQLQHPNIVAIHEVGDTTDNISFPWT